MKSITTQILLVGLAVIFLFKGGIGILAAAWKLVLPMMFLGGAYYFGKKALAGGFGLPDEKAADRVNPAEAQADGGNKAGVIEICPHCLSEVGSCPKCRKT